MARSIFAARSGKWAFLRDNRDSTYSHMSHGPILPMEEPGFFARLFVRR